MSSSDITLKGCGCNPLPDKPDILFFCLPISGEFFPIQIGQLILTLKTLQKISIRSPDIVFSSSGGNISAYLSHCNDWDPNKIMNNLPFFDSEAFLTSWIDRMPFLFFSFLISKSIFCQGYGFESFFKYFYNPNKYTGYSPKAVCGTEILSGVLSVCKSTKKITHRIYSNKCCESQSYISFKNTGPFLCDENCIHYLNGNVKKISEITAQSASIPFVVPSHEDDEKHYMDGGNLLCSPFSVLADELIRKGKDGKILKGIFFNPNNCDEEPLSSMEIILTKELKSLILGIYIQEIRMFINTITSFEDMMSAKEPTLYKNISEDLLLRVIQECEASNYHYGILLYPSYNEKSVINLTSKINIHNISQDINKSMYNTNMYVWKKIGI